MSAWQFTKALYEADVNNFERFVSMQCEYNLVDRHEEANVLPVCRDQGVGVIPGSPLAGGFLTGKYERGEAPAEGRAADDEHTQDRFTEDNWAVLDEVRTLADGKGTTPVGISLAWLLAKDVVDAPIVGPRTLEHLDEQVAALSISLSDDEIERLEAPKTPVWSREIGDV
jgi:aryl-alcohol dehydrogenase-like predicted oxidoreductase